MNLDHKKIWERFHEGLEVSLSFQVTEKQMADFLAASGDNNPIHLDDALAKSFGFQGRVVYGGLLIGVVSRLLGNQIPGPGCVWHQLSLKFQNPLYLNEPATLEGEITYSNPELPALRMKLRIARGADTIASGEVQAGFIRPINS